MKLTDVEKREYDFFFSKFNFSKELKDKTVLVTGSKGIVGSGTIKWILYSNALFGTNTHIIASTRNVNECPDYIDSTDKIEYCEFGHELDFCKGRKVDYIIHSAAPTSNKIFSSSPVEALNVILDGAKNMLELAKLQSCSMIYLSSEEAYGTPSLDTPVDENFVGSIDSMSIRSCYPLGKKVSELLCRSYFEEYGVDVKVIRPTVILGLWQPYDSVKVEAEILRCIMENKNLVMKSAGLTKKTVIYSLDAVTAVFTVLFNGQGGEAYNATNPDTFCTVAERARDAFTKFNPNCTIEFAAQDTSQKEGYLPQRSLLENISKIKAIGWEPLRDMDDIYKIDMERF